MLAGKPRHMVPRELGQADAMILLTHTSTDRDVYLGDDIVAQLEALSDVRLNRTDSALAKDELIDAARIASSW